MTLAPPSPHLQSSTGRHPDPGVHQGGISKGLERQRLIGSAVAGFNNAKTITKAYAKVLGPRQYDFNKGMCSPGSLVNKSDR